MGKNSSLLQNDEMASYIKEDIPKVPFTSRMFVPRHHSVMSVRFILLIIMFIAMLIILFISFSKM